MLEEALENGITTLKAKQVLMIICLLNIMYLASPTYLFKFPNFILFYMVTDGVRADDEETCIKHDTT